jgi:hypothetical protein
MREVSYRKFIKRRRCTSKKLILEIGVGLALSALVTNTRILSTHCFGVLYKVKKTPCVKVISVRPS